MFGGTGGVGLHEQEGDIDWDDTREMGFGKSRDRGDGLGLVAWRYKQIASLFRVPTDHFLMANVRLI